MKDHARIKRPDNLSESEILGALASRNIPAEDVTINEKDIEILYPYHPAGGARNHEFEMVIQAISAAKPKPDETALRQRIAELENAVEKALAALPDADAAAAYLREVVEPKQPEPIKPLFEKDGIKLFRGDEILIENEEGLFILKMSYQRGVSLVALNDWYRHQGTGETFLPYRQAYLDYLKQHGDIDTHPYSGEVITADNHGRIQADIAKLREFDEK